jgi:hypothetical protein
VGRVLVHLGAAGRGVGRAILPWLFLWLRWRRVAVATAAVPAVFAVAILAVIFTK